MFRHLARPLLLKVLLKYLVSDMSHMSYDFDCESFNMSQKEQVSTLRRYPTAKAERSQLWSNWCEVQLVTLFHLHCQTFICVTSFFWNGFSCHSDGWLDGWLIKPRPWQGHTSFHRGFNFSDSTWISKQRDECLSCGQNVSRVRET